MFWWSSSVLYLDGTFNYNCFILNTLNALYLYKTIPSHRITIVCQTIIACIIFEISTDWIYQDSCTADTRFWPRHPCQMPRCKALSWCDVIDLEPDFVWNHKRIGFNRHFQIQILRPEVIVAMNQIKFRHKFWIWIQIISKIGWI